MYIYTTSTMGYRMGYFVRIYRSWTIPPIVDCAESDLSCRVHRCFPLAFLKTVNSKN